MGSVVAVSVVAVLAVAVIEGLVRACRLADAPQFRADPAVGYVPAAGQGALFGRYRWAHDARGIRTDTSITPGPDTITLIGDSVVHGGNRVDQGDTVGAHLEALTGRAVLSVGAPGWSLRNALAFVAQRPEVLASGTVLWLVNSDDLGARNTADRVRGILLGRPRWHTLALVSQFLARKRAPGEPDPPALAGLSEACSTLPRVVWCFYPQADELGDPRAADTVRAALPPGALVDPLAHAHGWDRSCYADGVHPNAPGRRALAQALAAVVSRRRVPQ